MPRDLPDRAARPPLTRRARLVVESRTRQGWARARASFVPILVASVSAGLAYLLARLVPGHVSPFFAAVAAWICLGFTSDRQLRKVVELAVGATLGVGLGDLFAHVFGSGAWQIVVALVASALVARLVDRGVVVTVQAGVQAVVVVGMPALASSGPFSRVIDAAIGSAVALVVAAAVPSDVRRRLRSAARTGCEELAVVLDSLADGLRTADLEAIEDALARGRRSQPAMDDWASVIRSVTEIARVSPAARRHLGEIRRSEHANERIDRAIRTARVIARRSLPLTERCGTLPDLADAFTSLASGVRHTGEALAAGWDPAKARPEIIAVAGLLVPERLNAIDPMAQTVVHLSRSMVLDLLEATGLRAVDARATLPDL